MDRERLSRLLEEPGKVAREDLADLKALTEQFPWFSGAQLLRTIGERNSGDVMADEILKVSAAHIPSRAVLFDLQDISLEQAVSQLNEADLKKRTDPPGSGIPAEKKIPIEEPKPASSQVEQEAEELPAGPIEGREAIVPEAAQLPIEGSGSASPEVPSVAEASTEKVEELPSETIASSGTESSDALAIEKEGEGIVAAQTGEEKADTIAPQDPVQEELDRQILEAALASAYDLTWQQEIRTPIVQPKKEPRRASLSGHLSTERIDPPIEASEPPVIEPPITAKSDPKPALTVRSKLKFTDWLTIGNDASDQVELDRSEEKPIVQHGSKAEGSDPIKTKPIIPVDPATLIDRFIEHETPPPSRKAEFFTPQQAAKKSLDDTAGLVSETLAKIYEKQGNFQKAIDAYRKLALKYPEKSAYFAALSKTLEGKLNS